LSLSQFLVAWLPWCFIGPITATDIGKGQLPLALIGPACGIVLTVLAYDVSRPKMVYCTCCGRALAENLREPAYCMSCWSSGHQNFFDAKGKRLSRVHEK
jgi:hypothetical protein